MNIESGSTHDQLYLFPSFVLGQMFTKCIHIFTYSINKCSFAQSCEGYYYKQHSPEGNGKAKSMPAFPRSVFLLNRNLCAPIQSAQTPRALCLAKPRAFCTPQFPLQNFGEHFPVETPPLPLKCIDSHSPPQMCGHTQLSGCRPLADRQHEHARASQKANSGNQCGEMSVPPRHSQKRELAGFLHLPTLPHCNANHPTGAIILV